MEIINDPNMREFVVDFCDEALEQYIQLEKVLEELEDSPDNKNLEQFGQIIDRVMGAAKSIGANEIGTFCELGKAIGYKASQTSDVPLLDVVTAVLFDSVDLLKRMTTKLKTGDQNGLEKLNTTAFVTRLRWLSEKFKNIQRSSVAIDKTKNNMGQDDIDQLLNNLGL